MDSISIGSTRPSHFLRFSFSPPDPELGKISVSFIYFNVYVSGARFEIELEL